MSKSENKKIASLFDKKEKIADAVFLVSFYIITLFAAFLLIVYLLDIPFKILPKTNFDKDVYEYIRFLLIVSICLPIIAIVIASTIFSSYLSKIEKKKTKIEKDRKQKLNY